MDNQSFLNPPEDSHLHDPQHINELAEDFAYSGSEEALSELVEAQLQAGYFDAAREAIDSYLANHPDSAYWAGRRAMTYDYEGRGRQALGAARQLLRDYPNHPDAEHAASVIVLRDIQHNASRNAAGELAFTNQHQWNYAMRQLQIVQNIRCEQDDIIDGFRNIRAALEWSQQKVWRGPKGIAGVISAILVLAIAGAALYFAWDYYEYIGVAVVALVLIWALWVAIEHFYPKGMTLDAYRFGAQGRATGMQNATPLTA